MKIMDVASELQTTPVSSASTGTDDPAGFPAIATRPLWSRQAYEQAQPVSQRV